MSTQVEELDATTGVYSEVSPAPAATNTQAVGRRPKATQVEGKRSPSDLALDSMLSIQANIYARGNEGSFQSTFVTPIPIRALYQALVEHSTLLGWTAARRKKHETAFSVGGLPTIEQEDSSGPPPTPRPNKTFLERLPSTATNATLTSISTVGCYLGSGSGVKAVILLLRYCPNVTEIDLSDQALDLDCQLMLTSVLKYHPRIGNVNLQGNYIEGEAGRSLVRAVEGNSHVCVLTISKACELPVTTVKKLDSALAANRQIMKRVHSSRATLNPLPPDVQSLVGKYCRQLPTDLLLPPDPPSLIYKDQ